MCAYMNFKIKQTKKKKDGRKDENKIFIQFKIRDYTFHGIYQESMPIAIYIYSSVFMYGKKWENCIE